MRRRYYFIRHAVPVNDAGFFSVNAFEKDMIEGTVLPLSDAGKNQALELAETIRNLNVQAIVSSTLKRAIETGEIISETTGIPYREKLEDLVELSMGTASRRQFGFFKHVIQSNLSKKTKMLQVYATARLGSTAATEGGRGGPA